MSQIASPVPAPSRAAAIPEPSATLRAATPTILIAGLGYFVDVFDLLLFSVVRVASLNEIAPGTDILRASALVNNAQFIGLLVGGLGWGVLGDKRGRRTVLFGSILMYSLATLANTFVQTVPQYAALRFIAGVGLAGELGAALTLVAELVRREDRGIATGLVAALGVCGAVAAALVGARLDWRTTYVVGGVLGLALLALRIGARESALFAAHAGPATDRGSLKLLFGSRDRVLRLTRLVLIGVPIWYCVTMLVTFAPEVAGAVGIADAVPAGQAVLAYYICGTIGDFTAGFVSQWWRSRRKTIAAYLALAAIAVALLVTVPVRDKGFYLVLVGMTGFGGGYWATTITLAVEQFGTNLRATVGSVVPTVVRACSTIVTSAFIALKTPIGVRGAVALIGAVCVALAVWSLIHTQETFGKDLRFTEEAQ